MTRAGQGIGRRKGLPFGERLVETGLSSSVRFTSHEEDPDSGAIYMQARSYLAAYGKFAQVDPAYDQTKNDPESWNLYSYCTNNPVTRTDPDGRMVMVPEMVAFTTRQQEMAWSGANSGSGLGTWNRYAEDIASAAQEPAATTQPVAGSSDTAGAKQAAAPVAETGAQTKTETATISLVSRPIDTRDLSWWQKLLGAVDHAGWVVETKDASYVIQSGPNESTGKNEANKVVSFAPGKGQFEFSQVTDKKGETITARVNVLLTFSVSADSVSVNKLQGLVNAWNDKGIKYNPYPGPNSNTFAHWFGSQMNLGSMQKNGYGLVHSLPGWGYLDQVR